MAWIWWKPGDAIDAITRTPSSYLGVHRVALDRVAAAHNTIESNGEGETREEHDQIISIETTIIIPTGAAYRIGVRRQIPEDGQKK